MQAAGKTDPLIARNCPVCGSPSHRVWLQKRALRLLRCCECGMLFASPIEQRFFNGRFYDERADSYYLSPAKLESDYAPVRFERELGLFRRFCRQGDVLDVGCSSGGFLYQLLSQCPGYYRVVGVDAAGKVLDHAEARGVPVKRGAFLELDFGQKRFDGITFWAVLEHLADPAAFVRKAAALLKPGGHLFALVPNMRSLAVRLLGARYRHVAPEHLNYFTAQTLERLTGSNGALEVAALCATHFNPVVLWQDFWAGGNEVADHQRTQLLRRTTAWKQHRGFRLIRPFYSGVERLLGACGLADNLALVSRKLQTPRNTCRPLEPRAVS